MENVNKIVQIALLAKQVGNEIIIQESLKALGRDFGYSIEVNKINTIENVRLTIPMLYGNKIACIKNIREEAAKLGLQVQLLDAKNEIDRRFIEAGLR